VDPGHPMTVHVYTPGDGVRLLLDGEEIGRPAPERAMATLTVPYRPGELTAVAFRDGREIARTALRTVGAPAALRLVPDAWSLTTRRDDLAHVLVEVVDAHGRLVPDATVQAGFEVGGPPDAVHVVRVAVGDPGQFTGAPRQTARSHEAHSDGPRTVSGDPDARGGEWEIRVTPLLRKD